MITMGFPEEAYKIHYPAQGEPGLSQTIFSILKSKGIKVRPR